MGLSSAPAGPRVRSRPAPSLFLAALAAGSLAGRPGEAGGQEAVAEGARWAVLSAELTAEPAADGSARVTMRYVFGSADPLLPLPLDRSIPIELLGFADATAGEVVRVGGGPVVLWPTSGSHRAAVLRPPFAAQGDTVSVELMYTVTSAVEVDGGRIHGRIPVVTGPPARGDGATGGFRARVIVPEDWSLREGFPTGMEQADRGTWVAELPLVPALVSFRADTSPGWRPGVPLAVDLVTVAALLLFAAVGWRHMRGLSRGGGA